MARLTLKDVNHVAKLAKINLSENEVLKYSGQLSKIIEFVSELQEVDIKGLEPTSQTTGLENVGREDTLQESPLDQNKATSGTTETYNGYFKVEAILAERSDK